MKVNMLSMNADGDDACDGTFELKDGKIAIEPAPDTNGTNNQKRMQYVYDRPIGKDGVTPDQDPERWLRLLPQAYNGAYLRAELIGAKPIIEEDYYGPPPRRKITIAKK